RKAERACASLIVERDVPRDVPQVGDRLQRLEALDQAVGSSDGTHSLGDLVEDGGEVERDVIPSHRGAVDAVGTGARRLADESAEQMELRHRVVRRRGGRSDADGGWV